MVVGHTNAQGFVEVDTLEKLGPGVSLPPLEPSHEEGSASEDSQEQGEEPESSVDVQPKHLEKTTFDFQGVIESMDGNLWTINGQRVNVEFAEIRDTFSVGVLAKFEGYYSTEGEFIVTKIELKSGGTSIQSSGGRGDGGDSSNDKSSGGGGTGNDPGGGDNEGEGEGD